MYSFLCLLLFSCFLGSLACSSIDLHSLESKELLHVRKYSGFCLNTVIVTVLTDLRINQVVDNCVIIWRGRPVERLVECWMYEKAGKHLMLDLFVVDDDGSRRDCQFIFSSGAWRSVNFLQFHLLLRDLRLNSRSLAEVEYGEIVDDEYDAVVEFNEIVYRNRGDTGDEEESILTKICCGLATCLI